jgi:hypothetical protein
MGTTMKYQFVNDGLIDGVQYVTVVDEGGNPIEYGIPLEQAEDEYGPEAVLDHPGMLDVQG